MVLKWFSSESVRGLGLNSWLAAGGFADMDLILDDGVRRFRSYRTNENDY